MRFKDKVTVVTGAASGIGRAIAQRFAREGAIVAILDKQGEEAQRTAESIVSKGGKAEAIKVEATDGEEIKRAITKIAEKWGRIDILINNIGWVEDQLDFLDTNESMWLNSLDINLLVPMRFCREVLPYMVKQQQGSIVNIASIAGRQPRPLAITYSAAKAGVIAMTRSLAVAMAPHNIRVNSVSPGTIDTPQTRGADPKHLGPILAPVTLGRMGWPEDIAAAVMFIASDEAPYIVGQSLNVDGGNCML